MIADLTRSAFAFSVSARRKCAQVKGDGLAKSRRGVAYAMPVTLTPPPSRGDFSAQSMGVGLRSVGFCCFSNRASFLL
jgi:hypothetical protein